MKKLLPILGLFLLFSPILGNADTPPPGTVKAKTFTGDGVTSITSTGASGALDVNITNSSGVPTTVNQGNAGSQSWLAQITASALPVNACQETGGHLASIDSKLANPMPIVAASFPLPAGAATSALQTSGNSSLTAIASSLAGVLNISAASLPLPSGAATSSKQPSLGTSGTASTDVLTIQGIAGMVPVGVSGTFWQATQPVSLAVLPAPASLPLPTGAATSALQTSGNSSLTSIATSLAGVLNIAAASLPLSTGAATSALQSTGNTALSTINTTLGSPMQNSGGSVTANAGSGTFAVSGAFWQATQPVSLAVLPAPASLPLPSGAATSALQTTGNSTLSTINTTLGSPFQAGGSIGNASFAVTQATAASLNATVVGTVNTQAVGGATDSQTTGTVSTVITLSAPSNAQGFILQNLGTSTANIRFAMGATATTTLGMQLAPGQDSGFVPTSASVSLVSESGTQNYNVQWVAK